MQLTVAGLIYGHLKSWKDRDPNLLLNDSLNTESNVTEEIPLMSNDIENKEYYGGENKK